VIPAGAIISGGLAATGYYWGAKVFGRRPTCWLLLNMVAISVLTFFLFHFLTWLSVKGQAGPAHASFFGHIATAYSESEMQIGHTKVGKMGGWAYLEIPLEIIGFAVGGFVVFIWLNLQPYCEACARSDYRSPAILGRAMRRMERPGDRASDADAAWPAAVAQRSPTPHNSRGLTRQLQPLFFRGDTGIEHENC